MPIPKNAIKRRQIKIICLFEFNLKIFPIIRTNKTIGKEYNNTTIKIKNSSLINLISNNTFKSCNKNKKSTINKE